MDTRNHSRYRRYWPPGSRFGDAESSSPRFDIAFVIGSMDISGGTAVILEHASYLASHGHDVTLIPLFPPTGSTLAWHHRCADVQVASIGELGDRHFDLAIATWWRTVYELDLVRARHYAYFVQSVESRFYDESEATAIDLANQTYELDLPVITEAAWIQRYLALEHRRPSFLIRNGIAKDVFHPYGPAIERREPDRLRVLVEGPVDVPMKNVPLAIDLARRGSADEVWLLTSSDMPTHDGVDKTFSRVPMATTPAIYRSCDVIVKLSVVEGMFGPPLEMFHCGGTAIVWDVSGHDEYLENGVNALVAPMGDEEAIVDAVALLREDTGLCDRLKLNAGITADRWPSWPEASREFAREVLVLAQQPSRSYRDVLATARKGRALLT